MEKIKKMFSSKSSRNGTYSVGLAVIVIAIAIVINLVAGQLPENVRNIGDNAFSGCYSLEKVTFPSVLKNIGSGAFASCGSLKKIAVPDRVGIFRLFQS